MTAAKMKSIILSAPQVRRLLEHGECVVFDVMEKQPKFYPSAAGGRYGWDGDGKPMFPRAPGERRWVRETWGLAWPVTCDDGLVYDDDNGHGRPITDDECRVVYRSTEPDMLWYDENAKSEDGSCTQWRSPVTMPRKRTQLTVETASVDAMQIQEVGEEDAKATGFSEPGEERRMELEASPDWKLCTNCGGSGLYVSHDSATLGATFDTDCEQCDTSAKRLRIAWGSTHAKPENKWEANPWCFKTTLRKVEGE